MQLSTFNNLLRYRTIYFEAEQVSKNFEICLWVVKQCETYVLSFEKFCNMKPFYVHFSPKWKVAILKYSSLKQS